MTLRIARLSTECRLPREQAAAGALVDQAVREVLPRAISAHLGPSLDRQPEVCRLRALEVVVRIDVETLRRGGLATAWAGALAQALHEALARPAGDGARLRTHATRGDYVAAAVEDLLAGRTIPPWAVPELAGRTDWPAAIAILQLLVGAGGALSEALEALRAAGRLEAALGLLDEVGLERVLRALAEAEMRAPDLTAAQVVELAVGLAARRTPPIADDAGSRRQAIGLWLELGRALPVRGLWFAVRLLRRILEQPALIDDPQARLKDMPAWCEAARSALAAHPPPALAEALERLRPLTPGAAGGGPQERWLASDDAGLLLLCDTLRRLGWSRALREAGEPPRVIQALIAGAAMRLVRPRWSPAHGVEPAAALLAGMVEAVDRHGFAQVFEGPPPSVPGLAAADWPALLQAAPDALAAAFASRIRGFREAGRASIVRHFLRRPGRLRVTEQDLRVVLAPSPWSVVLRVSGADDALEGLDWLPFRRVSFVLEGL